jgi:hypothetical protein
VPTASFYGSRKQEDNVLAHSVVVKVPSDLEEPLMHSHPVTGRARDQIF